MGFLWDLVQQIQIGSQHQQAATLEQRVDQLETELTAMRGILKQVIERLEMRLGEDLDSDGKLG